MLFYLIAKEVQTTILMQHADMFESWKFVGHIAEVTSKDKENLSPEQWLKRLLKAPQQSLGSYAVVGVIVPNVGAAFVDGHKVMSTGTSWRKLEDLCRDCGVAPPANVCFGTVAETRG